MALEVSSRQLTSVVRQDELRKYLRSRRTMGKKLSLPEQRQAFLQRLAALQTSMVAIS